MVKQLAIQNSILRDDLRKKIIEIESFTSSSKLKKWRQKPLRYTSAVLFAKLIYPVIKRGVSAKAFTFFNQPLSLTLPSGTDIYLTGAKSHDSEIRLAKYAINQISPDNRIMDIGAHVGFFSLLFSKLVGEKGKIVSFEPSPTTYKLLNYNVSIHENIEVFNNAVSNVNELITFYEFPTLYSEYNSAIISQFENENWFLKNKPEKVSVPAITIDSFVSDQTFVPDFIKIDVEGNELKVLQGAKITLLKHHPVVVMEYLAPNKHNESHRAGASFLRSLNYESFIINKVGNLERCEEIEEHLRNHDLESDNIVFCKK